jgi:hypothetical protein
VNLDLRRVNSRLRKRGTLPSLRSNKHSDDSPKRLPRTTGYNPHIPTFVIVFDCYAECQNLRRVNSGPRSNLVMGLGMNVSLHTEFKRVTNRKPTIVVHCNVECPIRHAHMAGVRNVLSSNRLRASRRYSDSRTS